METRLIIACQKQELDEIAVIIKNCFNSEYTLEYFASNALVTIREKIYDLTNKIQALNMDLLAYKVMFVPFFDDFIFRIFSFINSPGVYSAYQVLIKVLVDGKIKKEEIPNYFIDLSNDNLQLIKIYVETCLNSCLTARILYLHRNTLNYRLNQLSEITNIDVKNIYNANFIYLITQIL